MKNPVAWWSFLALASFGVFAAAVSLSADFTFRHPQAPNLRFEVKDNGRIALAKQHRRGDADDSEDPALRAKAVVPEDTYDFDVMNPDEAGSYEFSIINGGQKPLTLSLQKTSCGCTSADILDPVVQPGESGTVRIHWETDEGPLFQEGAWIRTNDPQMRRVELVVQGKVAARIMSNRRVIRYDDIEPGQEATEEFYLFSTVWDGFEVASVQSNIEGFTHELESVEDPEVLSSLEAKAAYRIRLTSPADLDQGEFRGLLYMQVKPFAPLAAEEEKIAIPFVGERLGRVGLYGEGIDPAGFIDLGNMREGESIRRRFVLRIRDRELTPEQIVVRVAPDALQTELVPSDSNPGLFYLMVEVPKTTKACSYLAENAGYMLIAFDDEQLKPIRLRVHFAVVKP